MTRHVHLDPLGGIAGDMFAAALLHAWPALAEDLPRLVRSAGVADDVDVRVVAVGDEVIVGSRFVVDDPRAHGKAIPEHHHVLRGAALGHAHVPFADIRAGFEKSALTPRAREHALAIFEHLARAEAQVHGLARIEDVLLHEVGAQDSIADIATAGILLDRLQAATWSTSALPLGAGVIDSAHGKLPVPAPATALLLRGLPVRDDGQAGERVTPTGAAILQHLQPTTKKPHGTMGVVGVGWGNKRFAGLPNILRALEIDAAATTMVSGEIGCIRFDIDDQTAEDLAIGLSHVRARADVVDVLQQAAFGKKGRMVTSVRVLCVAGAEDAVAAACLHETSTLGVRIERVQRVMLRRDVATNEGVRSKSAARPDGSVTRKAEADDVGDSGFAARAAKRRRAEQP